MVKDTSSARKARKAGVKTSQLIEQKPPTITYSEKRVSSPTTNEDDQLGQQISLGHTRAHSGIHTRESMRVTNIHMPIIVSDQHVHHKQRCGSLEFNKETSSSPANKGERISSRTGLSQKRKHNLIRTRKPLETWAPQH